MQGAKLMQQPNGAGKSCQRAGMTMENGGANSMVSQDQRIQPSSQKEHLHPDAPGD